MIIKQSKIFKDVKIITPNVFRDFRGSFVETFNEKEYSIFKDYNGVPLKFVQDDISESRKNILRGLHGDQKTWKLVQCLKGSVVLAVVDMRQSSPTYLMSEIFSISDTDRRQILIPARFANGHLCMSDCIFAYKQTTYYEGREPQFTLKWNDPAFNIRWPITNPILSDRDYSANFLEDTARS
tara:strand:+ start:4841 stop:5386 length:546 start_codon:yes stop_codon:yes gene_type:complete